MRVPLPDPAGDLQPRPPQPRLPRRRLLRLRVGRQAPSQLPRSARPSNDASGEVQEPVQERHLCPPLSPRPFRRRKQGTYCAPVLTLF